jgi:hypothetical protein
MHLFFAFTHSQLCNPWSSRSKLSGCVSAYSWIMDAINYLVRFWYMILSIQRSSIFYEQVLPGCNLSMNMSSYKHPLKRRILRHHLGSPWFTFYPLKYLCIIFRNSDQICGNRCSWTSLHLDFLTRFNRDQKWLVLGRLDISPRHL